MIIDLIITIGIAVNMSHIGKVRGTDHESYIILASYLIKIISLD